MVGESTQAPPAGPSAGRFLLNFRLKIAPVAAMVLRRFTGNASTRSSKKANTRTLPCTSITTYHLLRNGTQDAKSFTAVMLELKFVHFMCKMWHLVRPVLLTIIRKFWPSVVHYTDTADFISQNST